MLLLWSLNMPTGTTDFNQPLATDPTSPGQGIAQTGNRLLMGGGSNSATGRWLFSDGFEDGLAAWNFTASAYATIEKTTVYQGAQSLKMSTPATLNHVTAADRFFFPQGKRFGVEFCFGVNIGGPMEIGLKIAGPNSVVGKTSIASIIIVISSSGVANLYYDVNGTRTLISNINSYILAIPYYWHYVKFVYDPYNDAAVRVFFDDLVFDLGNVPGYSVFGGVRYVNVQISVKTTTAAAVSATIDNVIITADEP